MSNGNDEEDDRRASAIATINDLWPPDSEYADTQAHGREDLLLALCAQWRCLPVPVLEHMAELQHIRDNHF